MTISVVHAYAQTQQVSGKVTDARDGTPLPGVTVRIKGTTTGTITDQNGIYKLNAFPNDVLIVSFTGYFAKEQAVGDRTALNVNLNQDEKSLDEVVVVGYGTQERRDITGSVSTVKGDAIKSLATPSFEKQLAGQVTGVQVNTPSGILGQPARIRIRGTNSISSGTEPLYVIDGVPYISGDQSGSASVPYNPLGDINPSDIESFEVLKDGSATAIYGSRASNGVILISTKKGRMGKGRLNYDTWLAIATPSKKFDLMNAEEFMLITNEKIKNNRATDPATALQPAGKYYDTDWQDIVLRNAFQQNHNLSFSGATETTNYYFSLGYTNLDGIALANDQKKYSARARLEHTAFDRLKIGINMGATHTTDNGLNIGTNALSGNIGGAIRMLPNVPAMNEDGTYNFSADGAKLGRAGNGQDIDDNYTNIKFVLENNIHKNTTLNLTGNAFADLEVIKGLSLRTQIGVNYLNGEYYRYWSPIHGDGRGVNGSTTQSSMPKFRYNWQNTLTYSKTFGKHKVNVVGGLEYQKTRNRMFNAQGSNLAAGIFGGDGVISDVWGTRTIAGTYTENAFQSVFGRANYSFDDRYLLTATLRHDKISDLPWGKQGVTLPGASIGWRISEENFWKESQSLSFISSLKLRGGVAKVGNVDIPAYGYAGLFGAFVYGDLSGIQFKQIGNPDLQFETSVKVNAGLDVGLFEDRIQFTADYFRNNVDNMILAVPLPPSLGVPKNQILQNIGKMYNQGVELAVSGEAYNNGKLRWTSNLNLTLVNNKVTQLANNNADIEGTYHIVRVNQPVGVFYGFQSRGVNPANGNTLWEKADGSIVQGNIANSTYYKYDPSKPDDFTAGSVSSLTGADKRVLGQANPTWYGGFINTVSYKNFELNVNFVFSGGNKVYNATAQETLANMKFQNAGRILLDRWTTPGQQTDVPKLRYGAAPGNFINQNGHTNSRFLEDGSFLRAQNIGLSYNVPSALLSKAKINNLRIYAQVQNAFIITKYTGLDPELTTITVVENSANASRNWQAGLDYNANPVPRTYTIGINLGL